MNIEQRRISKKRYSQRPEIKAREKARCQSPEYRARRRELDERPEYKIARAVYNKRYWQNPEKRTYRRDRQLKKLYGITLFDVEKILEHQGGRCAICRTDEFNGKGLNVDHDHATGMVRGILCHNCNVALGLMKDNVLIVKSMVDYLMGNGNGDGVK